MKKRFLKNMLPGLFAVLLLLFQCAPVSLAASESTPDIVIEDAKILSSVGCEGENSISVQDNCIIPKLGTLTCPGAYVEIGVTLRNRGTRTAVLDSKTEIDCGLKDISVRFPAIPDDRTEVLAPGESCTFSLIVAWDEASQAEYEELSVGNFALTLHYTAPDADNTDSEEPNNGDTPDKGNPAGSDTPDKEDPTGSDTPDKGNPAGNKTPNKEDTAGNKTPDTKKPTGNGSGKGSSKSSGTSSGTGDADVVTLISTAAPATGDSSMAGLYCFTLIGSGAGILFLLAWYRVRKKTGI